MVPNIFAEFKCTNIIFAKNVLYKAATKKKMSLSSIYNRHSTAIHTLVYYRLTWNVNELWK